jgi:hypothetical protein
LPARALGQSDDPYAYDARFALFPVSFQAGVSQSHFGSGARAEFDVVRGLGVEAAGRLSWLGVLGEKEKRAFAVRAGVLWHFVDDREPTPLSGTVYPEDTPKMQGGGASATDTDLEVPMSQKLGGPRMTLPEKDRSLVAELRNVHSARLGWDFVRAVERARPGTTDEPAHHVVNRLHGFYLGYGWGSHWNLSPATGGGSREVGWRRFYLDATLAPEGLSTTDPIAPPPPTRPDYFPLGVRVGMAGAIGALARGAPGLGFGYSLELGALPGESGLEGYLFFGLGVEVDAVTRRRHR